MQEKVYNNLKDRYDENKDKNMKICIHITREKLGYCMMCGITDINDNIVDGINLNIDFDINKQDKQFRHLWICDECIKKHTIIFLDPKKMEKRFTYPKR
jgi:hypothetical protein